MASTIQVGSLSSCFASSPVSERSPVRRLSVLTSFDHPMINEITSQAPCIHYSRLERQLTRGTLYSWSMSLQHKETQIIELLKAVEVKTAEKDQVRVQVWQLWLCSCFVLRLAPCQAPFAVILVSCTLCFDCSGCAAKMSGLSYGNSNALGLNQR